MLTSPSRNTDPHEGKTADLLRRLETAEAALRQAERRARFFGIALVGSVLLTGGTGALLAFSLPADAQSKKSDEVSNSNVLIALAARVVALEGKTQDISRQTADPVTGKPTLTISGVNLQVVNGEGKTDSANGVGNVIVGYNERGEPFGMKTERVGSHHLVVGRANNYVRWGGMAVGDANTVSGPFAAALGHQNAAFGKGALSLGGEKNEARGDYALTLGGQNSHAVNSYTVLVGPQRDLSTSFWNYAGNGGSTYQYPTNYYDYSTNYNYGSYGSYGYNSGYGGYGSYYGYYPVYSRPIVVIKPGSNANGSSNDGQGNVARPRPPRRPSQPRVSDVNREPSAAPVISTAFTASPSVSVSPPVEAAPAPTYRAPIYQAPVYQAPPPSRPSVDQTPPPPQREPPRPAPIVVTVPAPTPAPAATPKPAPPPKPDRDDNDRPRPPARRSGGKVDPN